MILRNLALKTVLPNNPGYNFGLLCMEMNWKLRRIWDLYSISDNIMASIVIHF